MSELNLVEWLEERRDNARRIAKTKRGTDRQGWMDDVSYFARAVEAVRQLVDASAEDHANRPLRMYIALKILRAWNHGTAGFDAQVVYEVNTWIDGGMKGPIPWPGGEFFASWAEENGFSRVGEYVGFRFSIALAEGVNRG